MSVIFRAVTGRFHCKIKFPTEYPPPQKEIHCNQRQILVLLGFIPITTYSSQVVLVWENPDTGR